jgi:hypothetical protein
MAPEGVGANTKTRITDITFLRNCGPSMPVREG